MKTLFVTLFVCLTALSVAGAALAADAVITCNAQAQPPTCTFHSGVNAHSHKNYLDPNEYMEWIANVPVGTFVEFYFV
ncbi:MAG TPA: hypothetical protein VJ521_16750, partial [Acidobacteriota bacterium]|nr:hypothetical protein [Acidobacteriota bacterium]